jgi:hypothetical protein
MKHILLATLIFLMSIGSSHADDFQYPGLKSNLSFAYEGSAFTAPIKQRIEQVVSIAERDVRLFFPDMNNNIHFKVSLVEWDLSMVGGTTGRAQKHKGTAEIYLQFSTFNNASIEDAIDDGLRTLALHELHHIARGWAIEDNLFPYGIDIAAVNEGLAVVFAELLTGVSYPANQGPKEVNDWVIEIMKLPRDANYMHWVSGQHPDGRMAIGYKAGRHIIYQALLNSDKNIIQLSHISIEDILKTAGFDVSIRQ